MKYESPITRKLIADLKSELDRRGLPIVRMAELLNSVLEDSRSLSTRSDKVKLYAWMNDDHPDWPEPSGEIALAMNKVLEKLRKDS